MYEELAVLGVHDGLHRGAEHFHSIAFEHAALVEGHAAVEGGLAAESEKYAVGTLFFDDLLDEVGGHREKIDFVGESLGGLHRGDIGVDEHGGDTLLLHGLEGL